MSYGKLLKNIFEKSGYSSKIIIEECNKRGRKIDKAYLSRLINEKVPPPSEDLSRMFAEICNVDDKKLVLEGYIEKAPKEIKEAFVSIRLMTTLAALQIFENKIDDKMLKELEKEMLNEPIADYIISLIENNTNNINMKDLGIEFSKKNDNITVTLSEPTIIQVKDNAMFPLIPINSKISLTTKNDYNNGDILVIKVKDSNEDFIIRYALFNNNTVILTSLNKEFKKLEYKRDDIVIIGKVASVKIDI